MTLVPLVAQIVLVTLTAVTAYGIVRFRLPAEVVLAALGGRRARRGLDPLPLAIPVDGCTCHLGFPARDPTEVPARPAPPGADDGRMTSLGTVAEDSGRNGAARRPFPPTDGRGRGRARPCACSIIAVAFALPLRGLLRSQGPPMEEGFMLVFGEMVLKGRVPNRDFLYLYGPGSLWVLAGLFKAFGTSLLVERLFGLAQQIGIVLGVFGLARYWGRTAATICALISCVIIVPPIGLTALPWPGAVALGLLGSARAHRGPPNHRSPPARPARAARRRRARCVAALPARPRDRRRHRGAGRGGRLGAVRSNSVCSPASRSAWRPSSSSSCSPGPGTSCAA